MKLKEYGTDILSHDVTGGNSDSGYVRNNNTFKSSIMDGPIPEAHSRMHEARSTERIFRQNPLRSSVTRASYQDSNIFGTKGGDSATVQQSAASEAGQGKIRNNNTFTSRIFYEPIPEQSEGPESSCRITDTQRSTVFAGAEQEKPRRKKLGGADAGTESLFGDQRVDFDNKSNTMPILSAKKGKVWKPVRQQKTAEQRKNEELYGKSAVIHGTGKKKDGSLMVNNADWRNPQ